jgi:hypothetical protein
VSLLTCSHALKVKCHELFGDLGHDKHIVRKINSAEQTQKGTLCVFSVFNPASKQAYMHANILQVVSQSVSFSNLLVAIIGKTFTPLRFFVPPDLGSVKSVGILYII